MGRSATKKNYLMEVLRSVIIVDLKLRSQIIDCYIVFLHPYSKLLPQTLQYIESDLNSFSRREDVVNSVTDF